METKFLSGDLENIWMIQPVNGGVRYVHNFPIWQFSFSLPWEYAQIEKLEFVSNRISGGEIYYTPTVSVEGYEAFGMEGLCLGEDERHQKPFVHTVIFGCTLTDGRYIVAETSLRDWTRWQKMATKPFKPPLPKSDQVPSVSRKTTSWITKAGVYFILFFLSLSVLGLIGESVTKAIKAEWICISPPTTIQHKTP